MSISGVQDKVFNLIEKSFMSDKAKESYKENYKNRVKNCLFYYIESYPFRSIAHEEISNDSISMKK